MKVTNELNPMGITLELKQRMEEFKETSRLLEVYPRAKFPLYATWCNEVLQIALNQNMPDEMYDGFAPMITNLIKLEQTEKRLYLSGKKHYTLRNNIVLVLMDILYQMHDPIHDVYPQNIGERKASFAGTLRQ